MATQWQCDCGKLLSAPDEQLDVVVRCPACGRPSSPPEPAPADIKNAKTVDLQTGAAPIAIPVGGMLNDKPARPGSAPRATTMPQVSPAAIAYANAHTKSSWPTVLLAIVIAGGIMLLGYLGVRYLHNRSRPPALPPESPPQQLTTDSATPG